MKKVSLIVDGMSCGHCVKTVSDAVNKVSGVEKCDISLETKIAEVTFDESKTDKNYIVAAIDEAGFEAQETV